MMMRAEAVARIAFALFAGLLVLTPASPATAVCEAGGRLDARSSGAGGTGLREGDGSGTGGSGVRIVESGAGGTGVSGDESSGTGGTGMEGDDDGTGTGGTGVLGAVTGFGSVCVNGLRVGYDESTQVVRDGRTVAASQLAIGQVVRIQTRPGLPLHASRIAIENALSGPVTRVDALRSRVWVMDQPVQLPPQTPIFDRVAGRTTTLAGIGAGTPVDVSGPRSSDGVVVATRIEARAPGGPDSVTGMALAVANGTAYVGDLRSRLAAGAEAVVDGERVVLQGRWNSQTRTLERASARGASPTAGGVARLSLQGFVERARGEADFEIAGVPVDASALGPIDRSPARNSLIQVDGRLDPRGHLRAERIRIQHSPRQGNAHELLEDSRGSGHGSRGDRGEREEREERSGSDRGDRPERSERPERPERNERPERPERPEHGNSGPG